MSDSYAIGVDIGGTKMAFALMNRAGQVLESTQKPTHASRGAQAMIGDLADGINHLISLAPAQPMGIGIGIPGQVNPDTGLIKNAYNLGWQEVPLTEWLSPLLTSKLPIQVMKDADASLCGEYYYGAARGTQNCLYICIGSGLGGAILANDRLVSGFNGTAAGIGHIMLYPKGEKCVCGLIGCAETVVSGPGLVRVFKKLLAATGNPAPSADISSHFILDALGKGDPLAKQAFSSLARGLGRVISICISIVNPQSVVLGGGMARAAFDQLLPEALQEIKSHALVHTYQDLKILPSTLTSSAIGPASLVWYSGI
ncbi:MAG: ROK family protein [Anaerolineae bacterium]|nr:ROK family protein [Anaerolineae bacterium]